MESLKRPELLMSSTALITSLGTAVYTYRKVSENQTQINELKERLQSTVLRLAEHQTVPGALRQVVEAIQQLNQAITNQSREIHTISHQLEDLTDRVSAAEEGLVSLTEDALNNGIDVSEVFSVGRPKGKGKAGSRSTRKKKSVTFSDRVTTAPNHQAPLIPTPAVSNNANDNPLLDLSSSLPAVTETDHQPIPRSSRSTNTSQRRQPRRGRKPIPEPESESEEDEDDDESDDDEIDGVIAAVRRGNRSGGR